MRFRAKYVSASESGDYYQVAFENTDPASDAADADGADSPYLLIQRQFEDPDGGRCYVETHDEKYIGNFRLRSIEFSPSRPLLEIARHRNNRVEVFFDIGQSEKQNSHQRRWSKMWPADSQSEISSEAVCALCGHKLELKRLQSTFC